MVKKVVFGQDGMKMVKNNINANMLKVVQMVYSQNLIPLDESLKQLTMIKEVF